MQGGAHEDGSENRVQLERDDECREGNGGSLDRRPRVSLVVTP
jgi:hypothetical protein